MRVHSSQSIVHRMLREAAIFCLLCAGAFLFVSQVQAQAPVCGNNITEPGEVCDGSDLNGFTCATVAAGFKSGTLKSKADCSGYDVSQCVRGNTIHVVDSLGNPSCEQADVQRAINGASDGDTIIVPAGTCNWIAFNTSLPAIEISNKSISLKGAGIGNTIINFTGGISYTWPHSRECGIGIGTDAQKPFEISGFTFLEKSGAVTGFINVAGPWRNWRIHHNTFNLRDNRAMVINGYSDNTYGLIDHNNFIPPEGGQQIIMQSTGHPPNQPSGTSDWLLPSTLGTVGAVYIEDNIFSFPVSSQYVSATSDCDYGGRFVTRYNNITNTHVTDHGGYEYEGAYRRGCRQFEVYNNTFTSEGGLINSQNAVDLRGGAGVIYNNTVIGEYGKWSGDTFGFYCYSAKDGLCNGARAEDENLPGQNGRHCRDCAGVGQDLGAFPSPQLIDPVYLWNNTQNGAPATVGTDAPNHVLIGTDVINGTPKPGYVPYVYPHPLVQIDSEAKIIPEDRLPLSGTWESAGVEGGIPERKGIFADVTQAPYNADNTGVTSAVSAIQNAINACPAGQVVYIPAGTYRIDGQIQIQKSITLRGAGAATIFQVSYGIAISIGGLGPWPPPKANASYYMPVTGGATRGSATVSVADASSVQVGKMVTIDEADDPELVWSKSGVSGRFRASLHMVESKTATSVTFRPPLPVDYVRSPQLSWYPDLTQYSGVEDINFVGSGTQPAYFISILSAWNCWVKGCEFSNMPSKTILAAWAGHLEVRKNYLHDQSNGGPNSEGINLFSDTNWSLVVDNICVAAGFPQINIGDAGANPYYSGGFGNVIAYNYCVDSFYTDPPTSTNHGIMCADIGTNHSPHTQYNLVEGNIMGKFGADSYHGSGSHTVLLRNIITGRNRWAYARQRIAVQIDRRNLYYSLIGNVLGEADNPATYEYAAESGLPGWYESAIYRLGYPDVGNVSFSGTHPPDTLIHEDGGPRDLYVERSNTPYGATIIEGNWNPISGRSWTITPRTIPDSYFLSAKPNWFGSLVWPPVDPSNPVTNDPTIIPAGYRYVHGTDVPGGVIYGDVSGDGVVSAYDAALAARAAVGLDILTAEQIKKADVSGDGAVSAYDAALIAQRAVGLISKFPVEGS